ncbi:hypothetical protein EJ05DRAFT_536229 [Pseudovirgaria hyperparasitica]|uniref:Uncharacterized protein n=1 Tax=Pseudovirgaria hyperparasitica TaxID=470096 RepID=A0A6A6WH86_9PEZI|nr:uncharacterized protein EJ05DRAFT_536229 [Pseudovirgaria hyperparasitica]KAF2761455.1 hypothetical protein EJ05DRAFT_536229 [Pseudovirgaria hyperparasitica]
MIMPAPKQASEADIIYNKANVSRANLQRIAASWLSPNSDEQLQPTKSEHAFQQEEKDFAVSGPETLGMGAQNFDDDFLNRRRFTSNDKLLQNLLGKKVAKERAQRPRGPPAVTESSTTRNPPRTAAPQDASDEEEGRASMFTSSKKSRQSRNEASNGRRHEDAHSDTNQSHEAIDVIS